MLKVQNLNFSYSEKPLLQDISLHIREKENVAVIGPNGSGKSTLIKLIAGLLDYSVGKIEIKGRLLADQSRKILAKRLAYVPQNVDVKFNFSVRDVVEMGRFPYSQNLMQHDPDGEQVIDEAIRKMGLNELETRNFTELSGGEKQRTVIASALTQQSDILLLDEPTSALDFRHQQEIYHLLKQLCKNEGKTVLVVTHDINLAAQFCDRLILLNNGKIICSGKPEEVLKFHLIQQVYGVKVYIDINPLTNSIYILPYDIEQNKPHRI